MKKVADGEPHLAALAVMCLQPGDQACFYRDDDIDVTNEADVCGRWRRAFRQTRSRDDQQLHRQPPQSADLRLSPRR